jgi:cytochrome c biogenesis protein CcmG/thiol:disulfide interchange protein DsbE
LGNVALYAIRRLIENFAAPRNSRLLGLLGVTAFVLVACTNAVPSNSPGSNPGASVEVEVDPAPEVELVLFGNANHEAGEILKLSDLKGKPVVVNFWFPSCPPCVAEMPDLQESFERHNGDVEFVGVQLIGLDSAVDGQAFVDQLGVTYALGPDEGIIIRDYKVRGFPTTVFVDSEQNVIREWTGILNEEKLEELVGEILN